MIIGTAGHIDHGKSALVTALTGRPVDRLAEERRRGITIDLNFAPLELPGTPPAGLVDVPGHEDFVRTMVAGATGIDLVLLVIDLGEGPRPQTEEHLTIVEQLRIPRGIPVFTKADLVDPDWAELVIADFLERLAGSPVHWEAPAVVSAIRGDGIAALRDRLGEAIRQHRQTMTADPFRLPVDRAFSVAGVGTVVTGTAWSGRLAVGDQVIILPGRRPARIRSVEAYGNPRAGAEPSTRIALGLSGVDREDIRRGDVVVTGDWRTTSLIDVAIELAKTAAGPLARRTRLRVHHGTAEVMGYAQPLTPIAPGGRGLARLRLDQPLAARGGDRFVVRSMSPVATIGGGEVLDPWPPPRSRLEPGVDDPDPVRRVVALAARRSVGIPDHEIHQLLPTAGSEAVRRSGLLEVAGWWVLPDRLDQVGLTIKAAVKQHHQSAPSEAGLSLETLRQVVGLPAGIVDVVVDGLVRRGGIRLRDGVVALSGFTPTFAGGEAAVTDLVAKVQAAHLSLPTADELAAQLGLPQVGPPLRRAIMDGLVVSVGREHYASPTALDHFRAVLEEVGGVGDITPAVLRDRLGLSRKYLIPLLEWADRQGITRRVGDTRLLVQKGR